MGNFNMSAIPLKSLETKQVSTYLRAINENTDDCILTDEEVYQLKGGDLGLTSKVLVGLGVSFAYLLLSRRHQEFLNFNVVGSTFMKTNMCFLLGYNFYG